MKREIFESQCFDRVRQELPQFESIVQQKIIPLGGDLVRIC